MAFSEPKEKRQRVQSEDDSVPASTLTSPLNLGDTLEHILSYLDGLSLSRAELVCRRWNEVIVYRRLWRKLHERNLKKMNCTVKRACLKFELHPFHPQTSLQWRRCADMPVGVRSPQSVVIGDVVFVASKFGFEVYKYETRSDKWSVLPSCPVSDFGIGQLSGKLVTVGGDDGSAVVGDVYTYEEETQQWEKSIPPMPTPRKWPCVFTYHSSIAVCGGVLTNGYYTKIIEVFKSETSQWYTAAPLPVECHFKRSTIINDTCYLLYGRSTMCASLQSLFQSATPNNQSPPDAQQQSVWTMLPNLPRHYSALTNINIGGGTLLALGGRDRRASDAYDVGSKSWEPVVVGSLQQPYAFATAELLPTGEVILIGGDYSLTVHIGTGKV